MGRRICKLAIVGASARAAAFSALRAGFEVVAADLFADADLKRACPATRIEHYPQGFADWLARTECDAWLYTGGLENHPDLVARMAATRLLLGNSGEGLRRVRDPLVLQQELRAAGLRFPETLNDAARLPLDGSWLCKTYRAAGGIGVWALDSAAAADRARRLGAVYQKWIEGRRGDAGAVYLLGEQYAQLLGVTRQLVGPHWASRPWQYAGSIGPAPIQPAVNEQLIRLGDILVRRFALRGLVGVDLVIDDETAWIVEVNPRYTASVEVLERAIGSSLIAEHVAACQQPHWQGCEAASLAGANDESSRRTFGKAIVFAKRDVTVTPSFQHWAIEQSSLKWHACRAADIPAVGEVIQQGHPVLTVFAEGSSVDCQEALRAQVATVEARLYA
jgi:predicted ATP-grasp superfamily ATP-dependent carboligase